MQENNVIQLFPAPATAANATSTTVAAESAVGAATRSAATLAATPAHAEGAASMWAPVTAVAASTDQQLLAAEAAVSKRRGKVAPANDHAVAVTVATDQQNREHLTIPPNPLRSV